jgi:uncharacterized protein YueI
MMDEERRFDNELVVMKERVVVQLETKAVKTAEERCKAEQMAAEMERDVRLPRL